MLDILFSESDFQNLSHQISNYISVQTMQYFDLLFWVASSIIKLNKLVNAIQPAPVVNKVQLNFSVIYFYSAEGQKSRIL